jgi:hypothetical protein
VHILAQLAGLTPFQTRSAGPRDGREAEQDGHLGDDREHLQPKASSEPSTMMSGWRSAIARRPSTWPARIVRVEVGVESMRRAIPSLSRLDQPDRATERGEEDDSSSCVLAPAAHRLSVPA